MPLSLVVFLLIGLAANIIAAPLEPLRMLVPFFSSAIVPFCQVWLEVPALLAFFFLARLPITKENLLAPFANPRRRSPRGELCTTRRRQSPRPGRNLRRPQGCRRP